ncbi:hypothetical protein ACLOJK_003005 [Asimina triloba]
MPGTRSQDDRLSRLEQDVARIMQQTSNQGKDERIGRMERKTAERAMVWDHNIDGLGQQISDVREGMQFILAKIDSLKEERANLASAVRDA